jgi:DNA-binding NarL/FixJ family response regulator
MEVESFACSERGCQVPAKIRYACGGDIPAPSTPQTGDSLPQSVPRPRVLIADDNAGVRTAVSRLLSPSCDIVGSAVDIATLFEATLQLRPDVVLLDFSLPGEVNVLDACRRLRGSAPEVKVVALTAQDDEDITRAAYEAGCSGFVWKARASGDLLRTIHAVVAETPRRPRL